MVLSPLAQFLGTGNQTPNVPSALLERLFDDQNMRFQTLFSQICPPCTLNLGNFYRDWTANLQSKGVEFRVSCDAEIVKRKEGGHHPNKSKDQLSQDKSNSIRRAGAICSSGRRKESSWQTCHLEKRFILGGVKIFNDITVTDSDSEYFQSIFEKIFKRGLCAEATTETRKD
ncbi:hypothetical protein BGW36DRAFT_433652 [Talaromyces proteolyticus]|uniref:Uncharacterized protein n=1 Tax=Talaromyces proteolyticus TaxID=1131652 RepID=A0AAD4KFD6_9EURO|nr:uncharacterized protein BGW36DRAFT_433652 [Talaromyces proteolyticus]KAH8689650.1 hypothetical protein BGW36DRAFT_433652 [Talaromyces proteolyticus]